MKYAPFLGGKRMYVPKPIDTEKIILGKDILGLSEKLAKNTHEVWAIQRIKDGWKYGSLFHRLNESFRWLLLQSVSQSQQLYQK